MPERLARSLWGLLRPDAKFEVASTVSCASASSACRWVQNCNALCNPCRQHVGTLRLTHEQVLRKEVRRVRAGWSPYVVHGEVECGGTATRLARDTLGDECVEL